MAGPDDETKNAGMRDRIEAALINSTIPALVAVATAIISSYVLYANSLREHDAKMVEIAIGILRAKPDENVIGARRWAIRVVNAHSGTPFTKADEEALLRNAIPFVPSLDFSDPRNSQYIP
jgi:hypothetical protein